MQEKPSKACFRTSRGLDAADAEHSCFFSEGVFRGVHKITDADSAPELVKESNVGITYELGSHTASISNNGINYKTQYRTVKREIHVKAIGATQFKVGNVTAEQLPKLTLSNGSLAPKHQNDKNDPREVAELQYLNSNKEAVSNGTLSNGLYTPKSLREKPVVSAEGSVISWNKINGIANYVVTVNGTSYFAENQNSMTIVTEPHTEYNITVAGVRGNTADSYAAITENGEYTYTTVHIDADSDNVCDDCGKVIASKIRNMSVSIGSDFSMRFAVQLTDEQLDAKMIFTREGTDISEPVSGVYDEEMNCYIYTYNGIKTQWLADSVKAELVLNDEVLDTMSDRSVLNYCDIIYNASKR